MPPAGHLFFVGDRPSLPRRPARVPRAAPVASVDLRPRVVPDPGAEAFLEWLLARAELKLSDYRLLPLVRRLPACLRNLRAGTVAEARQQLQRHPELVRAALDTVLLGVTDFFRDARVFETLGADVLPELLRQSGRVRIWSAACSDGPELYSIAMLLAETDNLDRAELIGSDCRPSAIMRAASGVYPREVLTQSCPQQPAASHFASVGQRVQASEELRAATRWRVVDLLRTALPGPWDMILWRNMAIYLAPEAATAVWHRLVREVRPGGYIIVGKADHPPRELGLVRIASCIYQRAMEAAHAA